MTAQHKAGCPATGGYGQGAEECICGATTAQDQQSRAELLPCPFCGGAPELVDGRMEWFVRCNGCKPVATVIYGNSVRNLDHEGTQADFDAVDWAALKQSAIDAWNRRAPAEQAARALPAPENVREGEPYDNPAFEDLARTMGVWGTAQAALCAQFFLAGRGAVPESARQLGPWKCGNEFLAFHPSASHVEPAYRDGWNACFKAAAKVQAMGRVPPFETDAIAVNLMRLVGLNKHQARECEDVVRLVLAAAPRPPAAPEVPTEGTPSYLAQMFGPGPAAQEGA